MKSLYIKYILIGLFIFNIQNINAQVEPQFSNYMYNLQQINPAYVGTLENSNITGMFRSQWTGINGAPESQWLSYGTPLSNNRMGLGLNLVNDKIGPASYKSFAVVYAYNVSLNENTTLSLGINGGGALLDIDFTMGNFQNPGDLAQNNLSNEFYAKVGAGLMISSNNWYFGASVPNFFKQDFYDEDVRNVIADKIQYNLLAGYQFDLNRTLTFRPSVLANIVQGNPVTLNANANFLLFERLSLGLGYRYDEAMIGTAGFQILEGLFLGYSYDFATNDFAEYHNGSHEIIIKFKFNKETFQSRKALNSF